MPASYRHFGPPVLILVLGLLSYSNTFFVPFVLDDVTSILVNPQIKSFVFSLKPRVLGELSFALNYRLHGLNLPGYHLVNLGVHLSNSLLVYVLVTNIFRTPLFANVKIGNLSCYVATASALFFVAHPLQTGAVTYLAQRVTLLAAFFYLLTVLFYLISRLSSILTVSALMMLFSILSAAAAVFSKESSVTLPLAILLCEVSFFRGSLLKRMQWLLYILPPLALVLFSNPALLFQADISTSFLAMTAEKGAPDRIDYLLSQFPVIIKYLRLFIVPVGQNLDHDMAIKSSFFDMAVFSSFFALVALLVLAVLFLVRARKAETIQSKLFLLPGFGIIWFFVTISLESGLVPIRDLMFEQRLYIPSIGLVLAVSSILVQLLSKGDIEGRSYRNLSIITALMVIVLGIMSFYRNQSWQSEIAIWEDAVSKSPGKGRTHGALGHAYQRTKMWSEAEREYLEAIRLSPSDHIAANNLGVVYLKQKRYAEAVKQFKRGIELMPTTSAAHYNLGLAYAVTGDYSEAVSAFEEAIRHRPDYLEAKENLDKVRRIMAH